MPVKVKIPTPLQKFVYNQSELTIEGDTIASVIDNMEAQHPGIKYRLCGDHGKIRRFVNIYLNGEDIRFISDENTALEAGDEISIIPAIAGGRK